MVRPCATGPFTLLLHEWDSAVNRESHRLTGQNFRHSQSFPLPSIFFIPLSSSPVQPQKHQPPISYPPRSTKSAMDLTSRPFAPPTASRADLENTVVLETSTYLARGPINNTIDSSTPSEVAEGTPPSAESNGGSFYQQLERLESQIHAKSPTRTIKSRSAS